MKSSTVFSGVQPTGDLHLGNYLGAIRQFSSLQHQHDCLFCIVDLHAITAKHDPFVLRTHVRQVAAAYLASGIDPQKALIFRQSEVPQHAELAWLLNCVARMGWMERMTQFKDKAGSGENAERASVGLFTYPILMAADILLYGADLVPVGNDQKQHLELARDIARKFNKDFGGSLVVPKPLMSQTPRVMSLQDASKKMSKSDPDAFSRISLTDSNDVIAAKVRKATADTEAFPVAITEDTKAEVVNLITIMEAASGMPTQDILSEFGGQGYGVFKPKLAEALIAMIEPIRTEMELLLKDPLSLNALLYRSAQQAKQSATLTLQHVKSQMGF